MSVLGLKRKQVLAALEDAPRWVLQGGLVVGQVMTPNPSCIPPTVSVLELVRLIRRKGFRHLLVSSDDGQLLGVVSDRDVVRCFGPSEYPDESLLARLTAADIMSSDVISVTPSTSLRSAILTMVDHGISSLPVLDRDSLVGILTVTDLHVVLEVLLATTHEAPSAESLCAAAGGPSI